MARLTQRFALASLYYATNGEKSWTTQSVYELLVPTVARLLRAVLWATSTIPSHALFDHFALPRRLLLVTSSTPSPKEEKEVDVVPSRSRYSSLTTRTSF